MKRLGLYVEVANNQDNDNDGYADIEQRMLAHSPLPSFALLRYQSEGVTISVAATIEAWRRV